MSTLIYPKVEVNHLSKKFDDLLVLDDISFEIQKGEFVSIVGPTGCGKTTFLNLMTKLIEPTSGEIRIDGELANPSLHNLAFVFQEPSAFPWLTAEDNIKYGLRIKGYARDEIETNADQIIRMMGLEKYRKSFPHEMSVSMEQRVVIGRAFAINPDLLLMDEPYGQMDIKMRYYLEDEVVRIWKELGSTVLFITHNLEEAVYVSERIIVLTNKPTKIKGEVPVNLPRPRDVASPEFIAIRKKITEMIKWWQ